MPPEQTPVQEEPPPLLRTWPRVYSAVLIYLGSLIVLAYIFTRYFS